MWPSGQLEKKSSGTSSSMLHERVFPKVMTLGIKQVNVTVNLESDMIGKCVDRLFQERGQPVKPNISIDREYLKKRGLI